MAALRKTNKSVKMPQGRQEQGGITSLVPDGARQLLDLERHIAEVAEEEALVEKQRSCKPTVL